MFWASVQKIKIKFAVKDNVTLVFKPKRSVPFTALKLINKELNRLEKLTVTSKIDYSELISPTVYVKKK